MSRSKRQPRCIVIAGQTAGKTTFARQYLPEDARVIHFVNADLIAGVFHRSSGARRGRQPRVLREIDRLAAAREDLHLKRHSADLPTCIAAEVEARWLPHRHRLSSTPVGTPGAASYRRSRASGRT